MEASDRQQQHPVEVCSVTTQQRLVALALVLALVDSALAVLAAGLALRVTLVDLCSAMQRISPLASDRQLKEAACLAAVLLVAVPLELPLAEAGEHLEELPAQLSAVQSHPQREPQAHPSTPTLRKMDLVR